MNITPEIIDEKVREYPNVQPLSAVEDEHIEMLPTTFATGDYGWRDAEWVVQWYYRRFLGAVPNADRRAVEDAYGENTYEAVHEAISAAVAAPDTAGKLDHLTALEGIDVAVGSAFLQFIDPDHYVVVGPRLWTVLHDAGGLEDEYHDPPSIRTYERYLRSCRDVADRCDRSLWDLYRALWILGVEE